MSTLNAKPFTPAQKIINRIFGGKPKVFADVDINQLSDLNVDALHRIADRLGAVTEGFTVTVTTLTATQTVSTPAYELIYNLSWVAGTGYCYHKNVRFDIPSFSFSSTITGTTLKKISLYLVAKRQTIDFSADAAIGGVSGGGLASPLASSDALVFYAERVVLAQDDTAPSLNAGEEVICKLCSVNYRKSEWEGNGDVNIYDPYLVYDSPNLSDLLLVPDSETTSKSPSVIGWLGRLKLALASIEAKLDLFSIVSLAQDQILVYQTATSNFKNFSVYAYIRDISHRFTKLQSWNGDVAATLHSPTSGDYTIRINDSANTYILDLEGSGAGFYDEATFSDIRLYDGTTESTVPTGTIINLRIKANNQGLVAAPPGFGSSNIDYLYNQTVAPSVLNQHLQGYSPNTTPYFFTDGDIIQLYKSSTKWIVLSNENESRRQLKAFINSMVKGDWIEIDGASGRPALTSPRANLGSYEIAITKDPFNKVKIRGSFVTGNTSAGTIFTLPAGYIPSKSARFVCYTTGTNRTIGIHINTSTGVVSMIDAPTNAADEVSLETIEFYTS